MKTIKPESIALFCLLSGDVDLAKHLAEILPITCFVGEDWQQDFQPFDGGPVQSLSDAYSDYSVLLLIAAESEISVPEWLAHSEGNDGNFDYRTQCPFAEWSGGWGCSINPLS